jgi:hypothetical protein
MDSTQKCIRVKNPLLKAVETAMKEEHLDFSPIVIRAIWMYLEQKHPEAARKAKLEIYGPDIIGS